MNYNICLSECEPIEACYGAKQELFIAARKVGPTHQIFKSPLRRRAKVSNH